MSDSKSGGKEAGNGKAGAAKVNAKVLDRLYAVIASRRKADPDESYTAKLLGRGTAKIAQKVGEEAVEALIEAVRGNKAELVEESADLLYHLLVLWADSNVKASDVWTTLEARFASGGGIDEKKAWLKD